MVVHDDGEYLSMNTNLRQRNCRGNEESKYIMP